MDHAEYLKLGKKLYELDNKRAKYSPYISGLIETRVGTVGYDLDDVIIYDISNLLDDIDLKHEELEDYIKFLNTGVYNNIPLNIMNYMGHDTYDLELLSKQWIANGGDFVTDYIKMRFEDEWIRDHMYSYNLNDDPYYGLVEDLTVADNAKNHLKDKLEKIKSLLGDVEFNIAGGYVYALTYSNIKYDDIDLFFTGDNCDKAIEKLRTSNNVSKLHLSDNSLSFSLTNASWTDRFQIILRQYSAPTEIVHGFDVDCSGLLINSSQPDVIYCTKRALFAINNNTIVFDVKRMSETYIYRLQKYMYKNSDKTMNVYMPNQMRVRELYNKHIVNLLNHVDGTEACEINVNLFKYRKYGKLKQLIIDAGGDYSDPMTWFKLAISYNKKVWLKKKGLEFNNAAYCIFLLDIMKMKASKKYDYENRRVSKLISVDNRDELLKIQWKKQDPMTQVTSTFNPKIYDNFDIFLDTNNLDELYNKKSDVELSE